MRPSPVNTPVPARPQKSSVQVAGAGRVQNSLSIPGTVRLGGQASGVLVPSSCTQGMGLIASQSDETAPSNTHCAHHSYSHVAGRTDVLLTAGQEFPRGRELTSKHREQAGAWDV